MLKRKIMKNILILLLVVSWVLVLLAPNAHNVVLNCIAGVFYGAMIGFNLAYWEDNEDVS